MFLRRTPKYKVEYYHQEIMFQLPSKFINMFSSGNKSITSINIDDIHIELARIYNKLFIICTFIDYVDQESLSDKAIQYGNEIRQALFDMYDNYYLRQFRSNPELRNAIKLCQNEDVDTQNLGYMLFKGCNINKKQAKQIISVYG